MTMSAANQMSVSRMAGPSLRSISALSSARGICGAYHFAEARPASTAFSFSGPTRL